MDSYEDIYENLPKNDFLNIQKGILVNAKQIVNISYNGIYTMTDGHTFQGRKRGLSEHRKKFIKTRTCFIGTFIR